jgi:hypothetical protein
MARRLANLRDAAMVTLGVLVARAAPWVLRLI